MCEQCLHPHSAALWLGNVMTLLSPCVDGFLALRSPPFSGHPEVAMWGLLRMSGDVEELGGSGWLTPSWLGARPLSSAPLGKAHPERCLRGLAPGLHYPPVFWGFNFRTIRLLSHVQGTCWAGAGLPGGSQA